MTKKRFGISSELSRGFSETINIVENNESKYRNTVVPFSRIELDPYNPRKLYLDIADIKNGISANDPNKTQKTLELKSITELSQTIVSSGLINPIIVYPLGDKYRVVAGERRCLASILLGKTEIEAKVYNQKPSSFELKLIQWVENNSREDLTLYERIQNIKEIQHEYQLEKNIEITNTELAQIAGISLPQTGYYIAVSNGSNTLLELIKTGQITSLDKAYLIISARDAETQKILIEECLKGASKKDLRAKQINSQDKYLTRSNGGRKSSKFVLGHTKNGLVIKSIVEAVSKNLNIEIKAYNDYVNWNDTKAVARIFKSMIDALETNLGN
jgi:ParB family transcriptional regulator, chromosome partitioning protein